MTPTQLRALAAVARRRSVHLAAEDLVVSQPAVSAAVNALEKELGVELLAREGRGVVLTPAGSTLATYAERLLGLWDDAKRATREAANPGQSTLRLAAVTSAGEQVVPQDLASFNRLHPKTAVVLEVGNRSRVWELLANYGVDLAVGGRPPAGSSLRTIATAPNELIAVCAGSGRKLGPKAVSPEEMNHRTWLVREEASGTRSTTEELFSHLGIDPTRLTISSNAAIREAALAGIGLALLARVAVEREVENGTLEEWRTGPLPLQRTWHLVAREGERLAPAPLRFCEHLGRPGSIWSLSPEVDSRA
jgi:DNA-binding transcriptional LysR family regulator